MNFNFINQLISLSPLDFTYQFGLNNNEPNRFNYNDITILTTSMTSIATFMVQLPNTLVQFSTDNDNGYEINSLPIHSVDYTPNISLDKMDKLNTKFDNLNFVSGLINATMNFALSTASSVLNSNVEQVDSNNRFAFDGGKNPSDITNNQIIGITMSSINLITNSVMYGISWANKQREFDDYSKLIDTKINLINENIEANREFMQQARDEMAKRQQRFSKSNRMINS